MIESSDSTAKLDTALAKAQGAFSAAAKDKTNPHFRANYADLASVWDACRSALASCGVAVTQWLVHAEDQRLHIVTRLACEGEWIRARWSMPVVKADAHGYGSAVTYARRYALAAAVGVVADDDDDGNAASEGPRKREQKEPAKKAPPIDVEGWRLRIQLAGSLGTAELNKLRPEFSALPDSPAKETLRELINDARRSAVEPATKRISEGLPPESEQGGAA